MCFKVHLKSHTVTCVTKLSELYNIFWAVQRLFSRSGLSLGTIRKNNNPATGVASLVGEHLPRMHKHELSSQHCMLRGAVAHAVVPALRDIEAGGSEVKGTWSS